MRSVATVTLLVGGLILSSTAVSFATGPGKSAAPNDAFMSTDRNKDKVVDYEEYRARMIETFYLLDADKDGGLTITEIDPAERSAFRNVDRNSDNRIDLSEFLRHRHGHFQRSDRNRNGALEPSELTVAPK